jgi:hypothetical protein
MVWGEVGSSFELNEVSRSSMGGTPSILLKSGVFDFGFARRATQVGTTLILAIGGEGIDKVGTSRGSNFGFSSFFWDPSLLAEDVLHI